MPQRFKLYAVIDRNGNRLGVFDKWHGVGGADEIIEENPGARAKGCQTMDEANSWLAGKSNAKTSRANYDDLINRAINGEPHLLKQAESLLIGKFVTRRAGETDRRSGLKISRRSR